MAMNMKQIKEACFRGDWERDCERCPAYPEKDGDCCFGSEHEHNDPHPYGCQTCIHEQDCAMLTHREEEAPRRRILVRHGGIVREQPQPTQPRFPIASNHPTRQSPKYGFQLPVSRHPTTMAGPSILHQYEVTPRTPLQFSGDSSFFEKLAVVTGWGMVEGGLEMALGFFRRRRPD